MELDIETYFSPDEDTKGKFLEFIQGTQTHLRIAIYGLHLPELVDSLIKLHNQGVDVALVCDHTQARGTYERPEILQLRAAGIPLWEGTSQKHRILHHKFAVRDQDTVLAGSWNFSQSASDEANYFDIIKQAVRAQRFLKIWDELAEFIKLHEGQYQD